MAGTTVITITKATTNIMVPCMVSNKEMQGRLTAVALIRHLFPNCRGIRLLSLLQTTFSHILVSLQTHPSPMSGIYNIKNVLARGSLFKRPFQSRHFREDPLVIQLVIPQAL